jgi:hypothetical protein
MLMSQMLQLSLCAAEWLMPLPAVLRHHHCRGRCGRSCAVVVVVVAADAAVVAEASSISLVLKVGSCSLFHRRKPRVAESTLERTRTKENTASVARAWTSPRMNENGETCCCSSRKNNVLLTLMNELMLLLHNAVAEAALLQYGCEMPPLELNKMRRELISPNGRSNREHNKLMRLLSLHAAPTPSSN